MRFIITFATVTDALAVEAYAAENELGGEIIALQVRSRQAVVLPIR